MTTIYEDDVYPGKSKRHQGKTIKEILSSIDNPKAFISQFNKSNKYCLSDEIKVNIKSLQRKWFPDTIHPYSF